MAVKKCRRCGVKLINPHFNQVKCLPCKAYLKKYIETTMTPKQIEIARSLIGVKTRHQICKQLGISLSNLKRAFRGTRFPQPKEYPADLVLRVCQYYEKHGLRKTEEKFKGVKPRSIIERNYDKFKPRQTRWNEEQLIELVKMAGLVSFKAQAQYFKRPRANAASIKSAWIKKFKNTSGRINGAPTHTIKNFVKPSCPKTKVKCLEKKNSYDQTSDKRLILWVDAEKHLKNDCPDFFRKATSALAKYQRWVFKSDNPKPLILKMIKERELK